MAQTFVIYINPRVSPTGLKPCKAIHSIPSKKGSYHYSGISEKAPGPDYSGIRDRDFLELTFSPEELSKRQERFWARRLLPRAQEDEPVAPPKTKGKWRKSAAAFSSLRSASCSPDDCRISFLAYQQLGQPKVLLLPGDGTSSKIPFSLHPQPQEFEPNPSCPGKRRGKKF